MKRAPQTSISVPSTKKYNFKQLKINILFLLSVILIFTQCQQGNDVNNNAEEKLIEKAKLSLESDIMTPEVLWFFGRLGGVSVSPDGQNIVYGVSYYDIEQNKSNRELFVMDVNGENKKQLTESAAGEYAATWRPDGEKIAYLSGGQLWEMNADGSQKEQITDFETGISNFAFSPKQSKILFTMDVKVDNTVQDLHSDLPLTNGRVIDKLMYRHWDVWEDENYSHIFVADYENGKISNEKDIIPSEPYDSPLKPWGGIEEIAWSPDAKTIAYTCKKLTGKDYAVSTNSEIYLYDIESVRTTNLTEGMPGYDRSPLFSNDGSKLVWLSMERATFEADQDRIFIYDVNSGQKTNYSKNFAHSAFGLQWAADDKSIYFVSGIEATHQICKLDISSGDISQITTGNYDYHSVALAGNDLIATRVTMSKPQEIYKVNAITGEATELSFENKDILSQLTFGNIEKRFVKTTDGKDMLTWIIYPPHFDKTKKYPTILYCQGGPQSALSQFWSYRWNFQMMAASGYIIVAPNRRGVPTFGQEWTDQISKDNGGQDLKDLLSAIDELKKEPFIDEDNLGAIGASYGGFSVFTLAGMHEKRFKAFISHCGIFNSEMMYATTEETFFDNWEKGGAYWETDNLTAMKSFANSPHKFVQNWDTPILIISGENDFRIPYTQSMAAFNSAQLLGVPSRLLIYPTENHWVLSPQNGILWQRTFKDWLDRWLK